jgi:inositol-phosphate phosphatase/L-galactose 1-phosphate phosphatase/histidinol-phosphatase|tara:strand:+ start:5697 stop:6494 length:798 start_codon:yes stop_codon:yes gene_type:complete
MNANSIERFVDIAIKLVDSSGPIILDYFRTNLSFEKKNDESPVTKADQEVESLILNILEKELPEHGVLGEEHGGKRLDSEYVWVIDPIDGTRAFINGIPLFGTLIALTHNGIPIVGIIDHPALEERWLGIDGAPTLHWGRGNSGAPVETRSCQSLDTAMLCSTSPDMFSTEERNKFERVSKAACDTRFGTDCYAYSMIASGQTDLVVEAGMYPYDYLAHAVVVTGAGGIISDWQGMPLTLTSTGTVVAAGDKKIHSEALKLLSVI